DSTARNPVLDLSHLGNEFGVVPQITRTSPVSAHLVKIAATHRNASERRGEIFNQSASLVVVHPVFQKMKSSSVFAVAVTTPIPIQFDHCKKILRSVIIRLYFQHSRESEGDFKKGPAIDAIKI